MVVCSQVALIGIIFINSLILTTCDIVTGGGVRRQRHEEALKTIVNPQGKMIKNLEELVQKQGTEIDNLKKTILDWKDMNTKGENKTTTPYVSTLEKRKILGLPTIGRAVEGTIAFYAYMSHSETDPGAHHILVYDHVVTNLGNGYNKHTGFFTPPVSGVYVFTWTTFAYPNSYFPIEITVNTNPIGVTYNQGSNTYNGATGVVVVDVNQGDSVGIRTRPNYSPNGSICSTINMRVAFSGWCLSC